MNIVQTEQELARSLLRQAQQGTLAHSIADHILGSRARENDVVATLLSALMAKGALSALEVARILVRAAGLSPPATASIAPTGAPTFPAASDASQALTHALPTAESRTASGG